jgi:hypothetical protein
MKIQLFVMPAWMAGIQGPQDASGDIHVTWIPALHAGMTESRVPLQLTDPPPTRIF